MGRATRAGMSVRMGIVCRMGSNCTKQAYMIKHTRGQHSKPLSSNLTILGL